MFPVNESEFPVNYLGPMQQPTVHDPYASIGLFQPCFGSNNAASSSRSSNYYNSMNDTRQYGGYTTSMNGGRRYHHQNFYEPDTNVNKNYYHAHNYSNEPDWMKWSSGGTNFRNQYSMNPNNLRMSSGMSDLITSYF